MVIEYQKPDYMTPLFWHFTSVWFSCGDLWKSTFVVVLSVYLVLPVYGFFYGFLFVCVHVNLNLSSIALACNISRARGAEAWHLSVTHLLCPSLMMPAWWQIALHACHPFTDRRRERDRESEIEREEEDVEKKSTTNMPLLPYSQPIRSLLASSVWLLFLSKSPGWWWVS